MKYSNAKAVFFDCWDTVISFREKKPDWNSAVLYNHALNRDELDWNVIKKFVVDFLHDYYFSLSKYEIQASQLLTMVSMRFGIELDTSVDKCVEEILSNLAPEPVNGISKLLHYLEEEGIYYAILSNTIYTDESTMKLISSLIPDNHFAFFLGSARIGVKKPNPLFFEAGLSLAKKDKKNSIYVGDSFYADVMGSQKTGFSKSIWLNPKDKKKEDYDFIPDSKDIPCVSIKEYDELIKMMKEGKIW